ncbi:ADM_collapsed_G0024510.mRNA.1.CDS.1 [Saccharomyces cerevisiae]|nr:ADM_collapsed_G0024510.mRNA.1.CDS.1 [Saccharomyces cerevisiae]
MGIGSSSQERSLVSPAPEYKDMSNGMIVTVLAIIKIPIKKLVLGYTDGRIAPYEPIRAPRVISAAYSFL